VLGVRWQKRFEKSESDIMWRCSMERKSESGRMGPSFPSFHHRAFFSPWNAHADLDTHPPLETGRSWIEDRAFQCELLVGRREFRRDARGELGGWGCRW
jgi:hypothetical protein